jgi:membrane protein DedA with SNARE-associated domain
MVVEGTIAEILAWLEPRALLLALIMPPIIRAVGHFCPEEPFMVAMGVLAARSGSAAEATTLLVAVTLSHLVTDHVVYLGGRWLRPRLGRFPRIRKRIETVTGRLTSSGWALLWFIPGRVFPLARGAWLAACGVLRIPWRRFLFIDISALCVHLLFWSGLGWWLAGDLARLEMATHSGRLTALWVSALLGVVLLVWIAWQRRDSWQPTTVRVARRIGASFRQLRRHQ